MENFSSFGFVKRWLVCRAKPNVLNVRLVFVLFQSFNVSTVGLLGLLVTFRAQAHTLFGLRLCAVMPSIKLIYYTILSIEDPFVVQPIVLIYSL
ncbi:MAG: hypothetical protein NTY55_03940, partial [Flavobacteriia bacterium]|nr:hypothetical protein [Flavobacteriia bacterium]